MTLQGIIAVERQLAVLSSRLGSVLEPEARASLERAESWAAEIRHFAVCWEDAAALEKSGERDSVERARNYRQASIDRLLSNFKPE